MACDEHGPAEDGGNEGTPDGSKHRARSCRHAIPPGAELDRGTEPGPVATEAGADRGCECALRLRSRPGCPAIPKRLAAVTPAASQSDPGIELCSTAGLLRA